MCGVVFVSVMFKVHRVVMSCVSVMFEVHQVLMSCVRLLFEVHGCGCLV